MYVSDLSAVRQVEQSTSAELTSATASSASLRHQAPVTVATVTRDVIRETPPPAYESLFPTQSDNLPWTPTRGFIVTSIGNLHESSFSFTSIVTVAGSFRILKNM